MPERPEPPPEGRLIADAARRANLSIREASRRAGISYGRWRQVVTGIQNVSPGNYAKVHAPAATLARMAAVAGVTAEQMETEGRRPDAAEEMRKRAAASPAPAPMTVRTEPAWFPPIDNAWVAGKTLELEPAVWQEVLDAQARTGISAELLKGDAIFSDSREAWLWDRFRPLYPDLAGAVRHFAVSRVAKALADEAGQQAGNRQAGLAPAA